MNFHVITLFPESFESYVNSSIIGRAIRNKKIKIKYYNPRDFVKPSKAQTKKEKPYLRVDLPPYGGGAGMVMQALPVIKAVEAALKRARGKKPVSPARIKIVFLSPWGKQFTTDYAKKTAKKITDLIIISGRYEGIDARVLKIFRTEDISVGPYVLTGGELPAMLIIDCISRQIEGVLGNIGSLEETRVSSPEVYTRPEILEYKGKKYRVPKILLSGNHIKIENWKIKKRRG